MRDNQRPRAYGYIRRYEARSPPRKALIIEAWPTLSEAADEEMFSTRQGLRTNVVACFRFGGSRRY